MLLASNTFFFFDSPIAGFGAMRDEVRYSKGEYDGRDRCSDSRAGGYAGGIELSQG